jgi:hypothetical protein
MAVTTDTRSMPAEALEELANGREKEEKSDD